MEVPRTAGVVVIGGGVVGCSIAYHLARRGQRDVVVLERDTIGAAAAPVTERGRRIRRTRCHVTVSYTHLTLPTKA